MKKDELLLKAIEYAELWNSLMSEPMTGVDWAKRANWPPELTEDVHERLVLHEIYIAHFLFPNGDRTDSDRTIILAQLALMRRERAHRPIDEVEFGRLVDRAHECGLWNQTDVQTEILESYYFSKTPEPPPN